MPQRSVQTKPDNGKKSCQRLKVNVGLEVILKKGEIDKKKLKQKGQEQCDDSSECEKEDSCFCLVCLDLHRSSRPG